MLTIREDDLEGEPVRALLDLHLNAMRAYTPPGHVHASTSPG